MENIDSPLNQTVDNIEPTQNQTDKGRKNFWGNLFRTVLGTTISILLTFGTNALIQQHRKVQDRKMTAMMVMSNIESFARTLEKRSERMAPNDSIAAWLLCMSYEDLELLPSNELNKLIDRATDVATLNHDHTAENIFSNHIETWKNVNNVQFIDNVGSCFSAINGVEEQFNEWVKEVPEAMQDVYINPGKYEGSTIYMKLMHSDRLRTALATVHNRRCWLRYAAATLRYFNLQNMDAIGISEQEVMKYTDAREEEGDDVGTPPDANSFYTRAYTLDSLTSLTHLTERIEELKAEKE
ncbi:MAG: hypothetical protein J6Y52_05695 [Bacteroidales bacterium]|nr:hypothetical protein [Bacteroidales bacterium]